ncbi:MAG: hypothetical protein AB7G93_12615 [Bdellovibrionales bacterium]
MQLKALLLAGLISTSLSHADTATNYLDLDLRQNRYLGDVQHSAQKSNYTVFSGDLNLETQSPGFTYRLNPVVQGAFEIEDELYFGVPEAYVQPRELAPGFHLTIGRKKRTWSRLDEEFNLGIWQPQLRWDYLAPVQQGLTGVFFDWSLSRNVSFAFFTSPLSLPDQGPQYRLRDGQFESSNRWFRQPHRRVALFEDTPFAADAPLYFEIDQPTEEDIVMHSSFGFGIQYHSDGPFWSQMNYAYKPRNQIHLGIECKSCAKIGGGVPVEVTAVIHPKIVKHHVVTWETGFERVDDRGWFSLTGDFPNSSGFPEAYEEAELNDLLVAGFAYQYYLGAWIGLPLWVQSSYMRSFELSKTRGRGPLAQDDVESSFDRYAFREVVAIDGKFLLSQKTKNQLFLRHRYSYSVPEQGGWLTSALDWAQGALTWSVGVDILGSRVDSNSADAGMLTRYRANDRVFGGLSYVF